MFSKVPHSSLGILRVPQLAPPLGLNIFNQKPTDQKPTEQIADPADPSKNYALLVRDQDVWI